MNAQATFLMAVGTVLVSGCAGPMFRGTILELPEQRDPVVARIATNTQQMTLEFRQLSEQMESLNRNQALLEGRLNRLETQLAAGGHTQDDLTGLRKDVQLIRAERETLKKEITEDLAARVEKIAARQQAEVQAARSASGGSGASAGPSRGAGAGAAAAGPARAGYEHKVERGQTLSEIARGYGKSLDVIMKANKISNPSSIRVGQVLFIPD
jgi:LysM repeat protein